MKIQDMQKKPSVPLPSNPWRPFRPAARLREGDGTRDDLDTGQAVLSETDLLTAVAANVGCSSLQHGAHLKHSHSCTTSNVGLG